MWDSLPGWEMGPAFAPFVDGTPSSALAVGCAAIPRKYPTCQVEFVRAAGHLLSGARRWKNELDRAASSERFGELFKSVLARGTSLLT